VTCSELALLFASAFASVSASAFAFASASALVLGPPLRRGRSVWLGKELSAFAGRLCIVLRRCRRLYRFFSLSVLRSKTLLVSLRPFSDACRDYGLGLSPCARRRRGFPACRRRGLLFWGDCSPERVRAISTARLCALPRLHLQPINVVVFNGPCVEILSWGGLRA
jgi:hypothetical protein